jgi:hypothetical protein
MKDPMRASLNYVPRKARKSVAALPIPYKSLKKNGGDDGTRTRGLCRDRAAF